MLIQLNEKEFDFVSGKDKEFINGIDDELQKLGYESEGIKPYVCWGKYVAAYSPKGRKSKQYVARFYLRDDCIIFRMYFKNIDKHRTFVENAPEYIKTAFTGGNGKCKHCENNCKDDDGRCRHTKTYTLDGITYDVCDGEVFLFHNYEMDSICEYVKLLKEFYPDRKNAE